MNFLEQFVGGVREDILKFHKSFLELKTIRYPEFARLWRDFRVFDIFLGKSMLELEIFVDYIFQTSLNLFHSAQNTQSQVFFLYLLYGSFYMQPVKPKLRIRLQMNQFQKLQELLRFAYDDKHYDIVAIMARLQFEHAFHYVGFTKRHCLNKTLFDDEQVAAVHAGGSSESDEMPSEGQSSLLEGLPDLTNNSFFNDFEKLHQNYVAIKSAIPELSIVSMLSDQDGQIATEVLKKLKDAEKLYADLAPFEKNIVRFFHSEEDPDTISHKKIKIEEDSDTE